MLLTIIFAAIVQATAIPPSSVSSSINAFGNNSTSNSSVIQTSPLSSTSSTTPLSSISSLAATSSNTAVVEAAIASNTAMPTSSPDPAATISGSSSSQITPAPSVPISSISLANSVVSGCWKTSGHFCGRTEMPWYSYTWPMYANPYVGLGPGDGMAGPYYKAENVTTSLSYNKDSCSASWTSSLDQWLLTAPLATITSPSVLVVAPYTSTQTTQSAVMGPTTTDVFTNTGTTQTDVYQPLITRINETSITTFSGTTVPYTAFYASNFSYSTAGMCCSSCVLNVASNIQVMHWPTQIANSTLQPTPVVSLLVDTKNNFTFTSPSIYVVYTSVWATNLCSQVGNTVFLTTLGFSQGELSTYVYRSYIGQMSGAESILLSQFMIKYTEATSWSVSSSCPLSTVTYWMVVDKWDNFLAGMREFTAPEDASAYLSTVVQYSYTLVTQSYGAVATITGDSYIGFNTDVDIIKSYTYAWNPCSPYLQLPSKLYSLSAGWNDCVPKMGLQALLDPPYTLTAGGDLAVVTTAQNLADSVATTTSAAPASTATTPIAVQTSTSTAPVPTTTSTARVVQPSTDPASTQAAPTKSTSASLVLIPVTSSTIDQPITLTLPSTTLIASSSAIIIGSQTLTAGGAVTASGTGYSLASNGITLVVANPSTTYTQILSTSGSGGTFVSIPLSSYFISMNPTQTETLVAGGLAVTASGKTFSLATGGASIIINGQTLAISAFVPITTTVPEVILANSQTLVAGGSALTISGTVLSLQTGGSSIVLALVGGVTSTVAVGAVGGKLTSGVVTITPSSSNGLAGAIVSMGGFGVASSSSTKSAVSGVAIGTGRAAFNGTVFLGVGGRGTVVGERWLYIWGLYAGLVALGMVVL